MRNMTKETEFTITEEHVKLLRRANVVWEDAEFGAPGIDPKRPYGNSDVHSDMGEILGLDLRYDREGTISEEQRAYMEQLHKETLFALQIALQTGRLEAGRYRNGSMYAPYAKEWKRIP